MRFARTALQDSKSLNKLVKVIAGRRQYMMYGVFIGTYGAVFKARHKKTGILVALKKLRLGEGDVCRDGLPKSVGSSSSLGWVIHSVIFGQVVREIRILSQLANGPNIVRLYGLCSSAATAHNRNR